ncbi:hypothetical protein HMPREF9004_1133 [Schaalia cardiffensis F0333]|uniref:Uncharacterized protein n=1 Tax=Schaalia cardiffensis F0333 TaxID=888050 RepID=N6X3T8_9ACTO|nr:hypothetical protein HMPREF9004_1133 [Schaalia cardiffensis F0333]
MTLVCLGSSPLTRGARNGTRRGSSGRGLIPAHAGSTNPARRLYHPSQAHPRSRGEHVKVSVVANTKQGSFPLTRGARRGAQCMPR